VYGCLIGGAIGDALGAPVEGWYYTEIREKFTNPDWTPPADVRADHPELPEMIPGGAPN